MLLFEGMFMNMIMVMLMGKMVVRWVHDFTCIWLICPSSRKLKLMVENVKMITIIREQGRERAK